MCRNSNKRLRQDGKIIVIKIYPDAEHAFRNPTHKTSYRAKDAADEWNRTVNFLTTTLKK
jgi:dienelactone hydrolase